MKPSALLIGLIAGFAAALLFAGLILQSATAVVLSLATPIPIFIASLGWGSLAGVAAAAAAALGIAALTASTGSSLILLASMALPAALIGHLAGLARPNEPGEAATVVPIGTESSPSRLDWYPLDRILFAIALSAAVGCLFVGWLVGYDAAELGPAILEALNRQLGAAVDPATEEQMRNLAALMVRIVPFVQPALLVMILAAGLHLAALIVRASGRLPRPRDDIPATAGLPVLALPIFAAAVAGSLLTGTIGAVSAVFAGTFGTAFTVVGLASLHRRTRGRRNRGLLLFTAYSAIVFLSFPLIAATMLGLFETMRGGDKPASPTND